MLISKNLLLLSILMTAFLVDGQETNQISCSQNAMTEVNPCTLDSLQHTVAVQAQAIRNLQNQLDVLGTTGRDRLDCSDIKQLGHNISGVYEIYTGYDTLHVFCDLDTDGGGWTVLQRRQDGSVDFERNWDGYKYGFGNLLSEYWLGNKHLHHITSNGRRYKLRIDLEDWERKRRYASYSMFTVGNEAEKYRLDFQQFLSEESTVTDSLTFHNGMYFTTRNRDYDQYEAGNCARGTGGFWYNHCLTAGLNKHYSHSSDGYGVNEYDVIAWDSWHGDFYSLKSARMMIKPMP